MKPEIKTAIILSIIITVGVSSLYIFYTEIDLKKNTTNEMKVEEFYWFLTNRHNRQETRNYAKKVTARMEKYRTKQ